MHPQPEEYWGHVNPIGPRSCYDEGKRCAETLFFDYWRQHRLRIKVARIFNTYGPRMHPNDGRVVSNFIIQALLGARHHGLWRRQPDPLVLLCRRSRRRPDPPDGQPPTTSPARINIGNPAEFTIRELAEIVIDITGSRSKIVSRPLPADDPRQRQPDIAKARQLLGWTPRTPLKEGLVRTIAYFEGLLQEDGVRGMVLASEE